MWHIGSRCACSIAGVARVHIGNHLNRILFNGAAYETLTYDIAGRLIERGFTDPSGLAPPPDMAIPPSVRMQGNIVAVGGLQVSVLNPLGIYNFADNLRAGGVWDYKKDDPVFQDFGSYHYGVMAAAADISLEETLRAGGLVQNVTCLSGGIHW